MHLFDAEGRIKKYETAEEILQDFYKLRLDYYARRKVSLLNFLAFLLTNVSLNFRISFSIE